MPTKSLKREIQQLEDLAESLTSSSKHYSAEELEVIRQTYEKVQILRLGKGGYSKWCKTESKGSQYRSDYRWLQVLQKDMDDVSRGDCQYLAISAPPRHGKTEAVTVRYPAYAFERDIWQKAVIGSHTLSQAREFSRKTRRIVKERVGLARDAETSWDAVTGNEFQALSVGQSIAGKGVQLLLLDDLIGKRADAESEIKRNKLKEWVESDIMRRINPGNFAVILIMTRWHPEDIWSTLVDDKWRVRRFPAICDYDPKDPLPEARLPCPIGRLPGEPLCPELWPLERLLLMRAGMSAYTWLGMYQQRPEFKEGLFFEVGKINCTWAAIPQGRKVLGRVRVFDYAGTDEKENSEACYTATMRVAKLDYGDYVVEEADRIQAGPAERDRWMRSKAERDHELFPVDGVPQIEEMQAAAAGRDRAIAFVQLMSGFHAISQPISGSKDVRADPAAGMVGRGACKFLIPREGEKQWHAEVLSEMRSYPQSKYKDYVDTFSLSYSWLAKKHGDATMDSIATMQRAAPTGRELFGRGNRSNRRGSG